VPYYLDRRPTRTTRGNYQAVPGPARACSAPGNSPIRRPHAYQVRSSTIPRPLFRPDGAKHEDRPACGVAKLPPEERVSGFVGLRRDG